ncbi:hypothetical protein ACJX0J_031810 [Zea mays]
MCIQKGDVDAAGSGVVADTVVVVQAGPGIEKEGDVESYPIQVSFLQVVLLKWIYGKKEYSCLQFFWYASKYYFLTFQHTFPPISFIFPFQNSKHLCLHNKIEEQDIFCQSNKLIEMFLPYDQRHIVKHDLEVLTCLF